MNPFTEDVEYPNAVYVAERILDICSVNDRDVKGQPEKKGKRS
ncbi:hypothetical protein LEP1GSC058_0144 [Leptospira fainei serovar Hurstbridge str. BUT 6]|uniref:Uncharacterized protein n=1 Tax=Leptospira fainei serovar Hurstbridge str. BUT 6 TaxID=1193011 RepID=S3UXF1_9LEPT|nr:hypothetical protein LEP1GSC058_0144 [Leptospira fainei serovar Hurstbridge str. BUT 6]